MIPPTIEWAGDRVRLIDQRLLPGELVIAEAASVEELCAYIRTLAVRGAPALGAAGAMGIALARVQGGDAVAAGAALIATRPMAVNLAWGVRRLRRCGSTRRVRSARARASRRGSSIASASRAV